MLWDRSPVQKAISAGDSVFVIRPVNLQTLYGRATGHVL